MKRELIAIALIALLVLTVVPMAATATTAPQRQIVTAPVYYGTQDSTTYKWTLSKLPIGKITINFNTGRWTYIGIWLPKGEYYVGITSANTGLGTSISVGSVTSNGCVFTYGSGICSAMYVQYAYNKGGNSFFIGRSLPSG
jgi:hypothetical protein